MVGSVGSQPSATFEDFESTECSEGEIDGRPRSDHRPTMALGAALECERKTVAMLFTTEDRAEGVAAFVEKRVPRFRGL